jgi:Wadjet protein JetD, C-terminal
VPRRFADARLLLGDLLDRHEAGTASPIAHADRDGFPTVVEADAFQKELAAVEQSGAIAIVRGRGVRRDEISHVRLVAPQLLYPYLDRTPVGQRADDARARLVDGLALHDGLRDAVSAIAQTWSRARTWSGFGPDDTDRLRAALMLAQAILDDRHKGMDYRTFSRRVANDSKMLERVEGAVVRLLGRIRDLPPDAVARPREALRTLGLERFAPPLLIGGRFDLADADLPPPRPLYLGLPPQEAARIRFNTPPAYLLTIENFASFNRHLLEADPQRLGTTIYVGGYPSLATQQALGVLTGMLDERAPIFHWSDIDPDGTWIFRTIERAIGRPMRPHLMSPEIAEAWGKTSSDKRALARCSSESEIAELVAYLAQPDSKTLEQEELDPRMPL